MSITYALTITKLETENYSSFSNVVINVGWDYTGTDENGVSGTCNGRTTLTAENVNPDTFVPYEQLNEDTIKNWVEASLDNQTSLYYREFAQTQVAEKIAQKIKDTQEYTKYFYTLPWSQPGPELESPTGPT